MSKILGVTALAVLLSFSTTVSADVYKCKIIPKGKSYWIPQDLVIKYDPSTASVIVSDHIIKEYKNGKHKGELKVDNKKRVGFKWSLKGIQNSRNQFAPEMAFSASYIKKRGIMTVSTRPLGYADVFYGEGKCTVSK